MKMRKVFGIIFAVALISVMSGTLSACAKNESNLNNENENMETTKIKIKTGETTFTVNLADNSSSRALIKLLENGPVTVEMNDYANMEKVGELPVSLPQNNRNLHTSPGDVILYLGKYFVIYYGNNDYSLTMLGKIEGEYTGSQLKQMLGSGEITVTLSL